MFMNRLLVFALLAATFPVSSTAAKVPTDPSRPSLIVVLVVDQMRSDYTVRFQHQWTKGLRRLLEESAWFRRARFPYFIAETCAGHATIATGSFPNVHGQFMNEWYDRSLGAMASCTDDRTARTLSYAEGEQVPGGHSARPMLVPTLSDELRVQLPETPRIVSLAVKIRSAIMLAGHAANVVTWLEGRSLATSSAYQTGRVPFVTDFLAEHPLERDAGRIWDRVLESSEYLYPPTTPESGSRVGWGDGLPHTLADSTDASYYDAWIRTPFSDRYMAELAMSAIDELELGQQARTDYLAVSFSGLDRAGHEYGPRSHEVQDTLVRLDATLGLLLEHLDERVGPDRYLLAVTGDHGVIPIPEQLAAMGFDAGRLDVELVRSRVDAALERHLGAGQHVAAINQSELYFAQGVYQALGGNPGALQDAIDAILTVPGVSAVHRAEDVPALRQSADFGERSVALSYVPGRSGDLIIVPKIYWSTSSYAAGHATSYDYDTRVPIFLKGPGVRRGRFDSPASPADIAPTLAFLTGITLARSDGRVLTEALGTDPE
jgi:predicted AlkP superfamily pyrophosphatase or phosphodiesterase